MKRPVAFWLALCLLPILTGCLPAVWFGTDPSVVFGKGMLLCLALTLLLALVGIGALLLWERSFGRQSSLTWLFFLLPPLVYGGLAAYIYYRVPLKPVWIFCFLIASFAAMTGATLLLLRGMTMLLEALLSKIDRASAGKDKA